MTAKLECIRMLHTAQGFSLMTVKRYRQGERDHVAVAARRWRAEPLCPPATEPALPTWLQTAHDSC